MPDREKILKAAKYCLTSDPMRCPDECPYLIDGLSCGLDPFLADIIDYLEEQNDTIMSLNDAFDLLIEQESVKPKLVRSINIPGSDAFCGACMTWLPSHSYSYCPRCGKKVKWDDA